MLELIGAQVKMLVNFNGKEIMTNGKIIKNERDHYLVSFEHDGIEFVGYWGKDKCKISYPTGEANV